MQLNPTHYLAIDMLMTGASNKEIAKKLKVAPETVSKWRSDFNFQAELNAQLKNNLEESQERLRHLTGVALDTIENVMTDKETPAKERLTASLKIIEITRLTQSRIGSTDPDILAKEYDNDKLLDSYGF